jgi:hypothetical protein
VNRFLPYFRQWLICCLLSADYFCKVCLLKVCMESYPSPLLQWRALPTGYFCSLCFLKFAWSAVLPSLVERFASWPLLQALFTESSHGDLLLALSPSLVCSEHLALFVACSFSSLFIIQLVFLWGRGHSVQGAIWFIPWVAVAVPHVAHLLTYWSVSPKQVWSQRLAVWEPCWFLSVMWHGEALCVLRVQGVGVLPILVFFFSQVWLLHLSKIFDLGSPRCLLPASSHYLGSASCL